MLNWLTRYAFVGAALDLDGDGRLRESVLDVGCGPYGLSTIAPAAEFVGVDLEFPGSVAPGMLAFRNEPGPLPFADGAFDTVVCLDVLEHVPPCDRGAFVGELARVAARRVLVACPSDEGAWIDELLRHAYATRGVPAPTWLDEHEQHGLPTAREIAGFCAAPAGFRVEELAMTNGLLSTLAVMADMLPELAARAAAEFRDERERWLEVFRESRFGSCYRKGYRLERLERREAAVDPAALAPTAFAAALCPSCKARGLRARDGGAACDSCGHALGCDASGAWDLTGRIDATRLRDAGHLV
jgi:SAM-dependent methyltransferase